MSHTKNSLFVGKVRKHFKQLPSTNGYALDLLSKSNPCEGTVITTDNQVDGRGQIGSKWESAAGQNITISIILRPNFLEVRNQFLLNQAIALGVASFTQQHISEGVKVKWPNDIYIHKKKVAGILIQNQLSGSKIQSTVVGLGININQTQFLSDAPNPTSFKLTTQQHYNISALTDMLCKCIELSYLDLRQRKITKLQNNYLSNLFQYQKLAHYQRSDGRVFQGTIIGLTPFGKLQIETKKGIEAFDIKTVKFVL